VIRFAFGDLLASTGAATLHPGRDDARELVGVTSDSRVVRSGQLFVSIGGPNFDGDAFAGAALEAGAAAALVRAAETARRLPEHAPVAIAADTVRALGDLASWHRSRLACPVLAITGSVGKTSTKDAAAALLSRAGAVVAAPKSFNNAIGVPHTLLLADDDARSVVLEVGTSAPGEIAALTRIARPSVGIITAIGQSHLAELGGLDGVCEEKGQLGAGLRPDDWLVLDAGGAFVDRLRAMTRARVRTFGLDEPRADWNATQVVEESDGVRFRLEVSDGRRFEVRVPLVGRHNAANTAAAIAAVDAMGFDPNELLSGLEELRPAPHRMNLVRTTRGVELIDDTYNSNPDSARNAVRVLASRQGAGRRVAVLGDMLELGAQSAELHRQLGREVANARIELLVCVGELAREIATGAREAGVHASRILTYTDVGEAIAEVPERLRTDDVVLFKASRGLALERAVDAVADRLGRGTHRVG